MDIDYDKLTKRVRELLCSKLEPKPMPSGGYETSIVSSIVASEKLRLNLSNTKGVKILGGCDECLDMRKLKTAKRLSSDYGGSVFDLGSKGGVVKVKELHSEAMAKDSIAAAIQIGKLGVGPKISSWRVCECGNDLYLVVQMDKIERGTPLRKWLNKRRAKADVAKLQAKLEAKTQKMKNAGIEFTNMWSDNVMVDGKGEPWVIGFGYLPYKFEASIEWMFRDHGKRQSNEEGAIYAALVREGLVSVKKAEGSAPAGLLTAS
jgi:hypothetical protein